MAQERLERVEREWAAKVTRLAEETKMGAVQMKKQNDEILVEIDDAIKSLQSTVKAIQEQKQKPRK